MTPKDFIGSDLGRASPGQCFVKLLKLELDVRFQLKGRHFVWQERERERERERRPGVFPRWHQIPIGSCCIHQIVACALAA